MGKLIVLEGADGSGKATQARLLCERLAAVPISFPDYASDGSAAAKFYLNGGLGSLDSVNVYSAAVTFAFDRYVSWVNGAWGRRYREGGVIIADRYVESNFVHQGVRLAESERAAFIAWLDDLEYGRFRLPRPDGIIYLSVPWTVSRELMRERHRAEDIHEADADYQRRCHMLYETTARQQGWRIVECTSGGAMRDAADIADDVCGIARSIMEARRDA